MGSLPVRTLDHLVRWTGLVALVAAPAAAATTTLVACSLEHLYGGSDAIADADAAQDGNRRRDAGGDAAPDVGDAGGDAGASVDRCVTSAPWGRPIAVAALNSAAPAGGARLSRDELRVYFHAGARPRIYTAARSAPGGAFDPPALLPLPDPDAGVVNISIPTLSPDGLTLYFEISGSGRADIAWAERASMQTGFGASSLVRGLEAPENTGAPYLRGDGSEIYFASRRPPALTGSLDLFRARVTRPGAVEVVQHVGELGTAVDERSPVLSADGLTIYFARRQSRDGLASSRYDIWSASRSSDDRAFGVAAHVGALSSDGDDEPTFISSDACTIYLVSSREDGVPRIFASVRQK